jgi:malate dehydrogenase (oxaloacetate-decarboxylating)
VQKISREETMSTIYERALEKHAKWKGKLEVSLKAPLETNDDLSMAYTPGVAQPCIEIEKDPESVYRYTWKGNSVAIVTDGSAVLGLGDIGAMAGLPVMEGKSILFKRFAGIDAVPICLDARDPNDIIRIVKAIAPSFGGINLEDISAPRCVEIERALIDELDIPVFHDDQHGTAIVVTAGLINALKLVRKKAEDITVVISGTGAAGSSIIRMLKNLGVKVIYAFNKDGMVVREDYEKYDHLVRELVDITNADSKKMAIGEALKEADVFIGVSAPGLLTAEMVSGMKNDAVVFALANPEPEISYAEAVAGGARIVATGRSDYPNQINNVLAFPGLFRGAFDVRARKINEEMKMAAAIGIASLVSDTELSEEYIVPSVLDPRVTAVVAKGVSEKAVETYVSSI